MPLALPAAACASSRFARSAPRPWLRRRRLTRHSVAASTAARSPARGRRLAPAQASLVSPALAVLARAALDDRAPTHVSSGATTAATSALQRLELAPGKRRMLAAAADGCVATRLPRL